MRKIFLIPFMSLCLSVAMGQVNRGGCEIESVSSIAGTCIDTTGALIINAQGNSVQYSIDGVHYQPNNTFDNLPPSDYIVTIMDATGCSDTISATVAPPPPFLISEVKTFDPPCTANDVSITISTTGGTGLIQYSLDTSVFQDSPKFFNLTSEDYVIDVKDETGCTTDSVISIEEILPLRIVHMIGLPTWCEADNGEMQVNSAGGYGTILYSIDGGHYQIHPVFFNLGPGYHTVTALDEAGCTHSLMLPLTQFFSLLVREVTTQTADCGVDNGAIFINADGSGLITYSINGSPPQHEPSFQNLHGGDYQLVVMDQNKCFHRETVTVPTIGCKIYIPNTFSPNRDGVNEYFQLSSTPGFNPRVTKYMIFDRWGNLVYSAKDFPFTSSEFWWDGSNKNITATSGVFAYFIEVEYDEGNKEIFKGNITLVR